MDTVAHYDGMGLRLVGVGVQFRNRCFMERPLAWMDRFGQRAVRAALKFCQKDIEVYSMRTEMSVNYDICLVILTKLMAKEEICWITREGCECLGRFLNCAFCETRTVSIARRKTTGTKKLTLSLDRKEGILMHTIATMRR